MRAVFSARMIHRHRLMRRIFGMMGFLFVLGFAFPVCADGIARLRSFMESTRSGQADFVQQVTSREGKTMTPLSGRLSFMRPGQFRWDVQKPYKQLIVADGHEVWLWDADLNQATVKAQQKALGASPAAILSGDIQKLDADFKLVEGGNSESLEWVDAFPRSKDIGFERIRLGFSGTELVRMELKDSFGQLTHITLSHFDKAPIRSSADVFQFRPPVGADIIRE
jgi:outer membrane lipoprotein carrier protein